MNKKSLIIKIGLSLIAVTLLITAFFIITKQKVAKVQGEIIVEIINLDEEILINDKITFFEGDTLSSIIEKKYQAEFHHSSLGKYLTKVGPIAAPYGDPDYFIRIDVNDKMSAFGIDGIELIDKEKITFRLVKITGSSSWVRIIQLNG